MTIRYLCFKCYLLFHILWKHTNNHEILMLREDVALEKCSEMSIILVLDNETFFYLKIKKSFFIFLEVIFKLIRTCAFSKQGCLKMFIWSICIFLAKQAEIVCLNNTWFIEILRFFLSISFFYNYEWNMWKWASFEKFTFAECLILTENGSLPFPPCVFQNFIVK